MWKHINTVLYRLYYAYRGRKLWQKSTRWQMSELPVDSDEAAPILYVAWGRIGDLLLATGHLRHLRRWFHPHPVWLLGRPEVETIVKPYIDVFVPLDEKKEVSQEERQHHLLNQLNRPFSKIIADIHTFYGGVFVIGRLLEQLQAPQKFIYEGYHLGANLAPWRPYPAGFEIIPRQPAHDPDTKEVSTRHVLHHMAYYIREVLKRVHIAHELVCPMKPELTGEETDESICRKFNLEPGKYIAWQPVSNNPKKDYPLPRWFDVIGSFQDQVFVALGTRSEQERLAGRTAPNLINLCGQTTLPETIQLIHQSRMFLGLDSGLSHVASILGQQTICVSQNSNLGYFFPYPVEYGFTNQHTVYHPDYVHCSGCFMTCCYEPIVATYRKGALCLRTLPVEQIVQKIEDVLEAEEDRRHHDGVVQT